MKKVLAIDFGASSGRVIVGSFDGKKITLEEIHRFSNDPVSVNGTTFWDVLRLFNEILTVFCFSRRTINAIPKVYLITNLWVTHFSLSVSKIGLRARVTTAAQKNGYIIYALVNKVGYIKFTRICPCSKNHIRI